MALVLYPRLAGEAELRPLEESAFTCLGGLLLVMAHLLNHSLAYWVDREEDGDTGDGR